MLSYYKESKLNKNKQSDDFVEGTTNLNPSLSEILHKENKDNESSEPELYKLTDKNKQSFYLLGTCHTIPIKKLNPFALKVVLDCDTLIKEKYDPEEYTKESYDSDDSYDGDVSSDTDEEKYCQEYSNNEQQSNDENKGMQQDLKKEVIKRRPLFPANNDFYRESYIVNDEIIFEDNYSLFYELIPKELKKVIDDEIFPKDIKKIFDKRYWKQFLFTKNIFLFEFFQPAVIYYWFNSVGYMEGMNEEIADFFVHNNKKICGLRDDNIFDELKEIKSNIEVVDNTFQKSSENIEQVNEVEGKKVFMQFLIELKKYSAKTGEYDLASGISKKIDDYYLQGDVQNLYKICFEPGAGLDKSEVIKDNKYWMPKILKEFKKGNISKEKIIAIPGIGHLHGEFGLLNLFKVRKNFEIEKMNKEGNFEPFNIIRVDLEKKLNMFSKVKKNVLKKK